KKREKLIRESLSIPNFERVLQSSISCQHSKRKAWGSKYGSGIR
ncbi:unnamed protein product, partial [Choristocarpus tenellus]